MSVLRRLQRSLQNKVVQPDYAGLTNVIFHGRFEGLVNNTDNDYGTVNSSNGVTKWKSVEHVTGVEFLSVSTAPTLTADGIEFNSVRLRHFGASPIQSTFNNLHYRADINDLKGTVHFVVKMGSTSNPNAIYGVFGNNGGSNVNKGVSLLFDDRSAQSANNTLRFSITKGTSNVFISQSVNNNIFEANKWLDVWIEWDKSLEQAEQIKVFVNGFRFVVSNRIDSDVPVTTPSYNMEIGATGNNASPAVMTIKEITFMDGVMSESFRQQFITARMYKYGITQYPNVVDGIPITSEWNQFYELDENRYYLPTLLCQNPIDPDTIVYVFSDGLSHFHESEKKVSICRSTDRGRTWSSKWTVFDPSTGTQATQGVSGGYDSSGRLHVACCVHSGFTAGANHFIYWGYSDDDGDTWTMTDITSATPSDGLASWRVYGRVIENDGRLMFTYYKFFEEGNLAGGNVTQYLMKSDDSGATWQSIQIRTSPGTAIKTETEVCAVSDTCLVALTRSDTGGTLEWYQDRSFDNGDTWSSDGLVTLGESITDLPSPIRLRTFQGVVACYLTDRPRDVFKVIYATKSDLETLGASAWKPETKFVIHQGSGEHLQYGDVCHYDNDIKAIGMSVIDPFPPTGSGTENKMYGFDLPTFHYPFIKTPLGL